MHFPVISDYYLQTAIGQLVMTEATSNDMEEAIRLENELADELLACPDKDRAHKYTEVYEKVYSSYNKDRRHEMSEHYRSGAQGTAKAFLKITGSGKNILDIGCGFGHLSYFMAQGGNRVTGIDINRIHVIEARETYGSHKNLEFRETNGVQLDFPNAEFDHVISTSVFEHLHPGDVGTHLSETKRVLKPRGTYIFTALTPYRRDDIAMRSRDALQRQKHGFHINECTWSEFQSSLSENGFLGRSDIIPGRFRHLFPNLLIPIILKCWFEKWLPLNFIVLRILRLDKVYIVAKKRNNDGP
jgi:ubiquinone/menaquinone biosynthesis C-methylase UbiE